MSDPSPLERTWTCPEPGCGWTCDHDADLPATEIAGYHYRGQHPDLTPPADTPAATDQENPADA